MTPRGLRQVGVPAETVDGHRVSVLKADDTTDVALRVSRPWTTNWQGAEQTMAFEAGQAARVVRALSEATDDAFRTVGPGKTPQGRSGLPERATTDACKVCGKPMLPAQCYVVGGPYHVVCAPPKKLDVARVVEAARGRMTDRRCKGCKGPLPPKKIPSPPRVWCSEECRKGQYAGECIDCGGPTNGHDGPGKASERCVECRKRYERALAVWTAERLVAEAMRWRDLTGMWPTSTDWVSEAAVARTGVAYRAARAEFRVLTGPWPSATTARTVFGSWAAFMEACGGEAVGYGAPGKKRGYRVEGLRAAIDRLKMQESSTELERPRKAVAS